MLDRILRFAGFGKARKPEDQKPKDWAPDSDYFRSMTREEFKEADKVREYMPTEDWDVIMTKVRQAMKGLDVDIEVEELQNYAGKSKIRMLMAQTARLAVDVGVDHVSKLYPTAKVTATAWDVSCSMAVSHVREDYFMVKASLGYGTFSPIGDSAVNCGINHYFCCDGWMGLVRLSAALAGYMQSDKGGAGGLRDIHGRPQQEWENSGPHLDIT